MKKIKKILLSALTITALVSAMLFTSGCSSNSEYPVTLASYTFTSQPKSVVCLNDSVADIILACGYGEKITARSDECTQETLSSTRSVGSAAKPDVNEIKKLNPDVVFADKTLGEDVRLQLKNANITVVTLVPASSTEELSVLYGNIAAILDGNNTGRSVGKDKAEKLSLTLSDLQRIVPENNVAVTACYLYDVNGTAETSATFGGKLFDYANILNVCTTEESSKDIEALKLSNPQYIFCDTGVKAQIESNYQFKDLKAVKDGNVFELPAKYLSRQGNSLTEALSFIIETVYEVSGTSNNTNENSKNEESSKPESSIAENSTPENSKTESSAPQNSEPENSESSSVSVKADTTLEITPDLSISLYDNTENVSILQNRLKYLGYFDEDITGYYGNMTGESVLKFKQNNNMTTDGNTLNSKELDIMFSENAIPAEGFPKE
ncbi:MAG: ABC transporter substrate-binding protein [Acutalibacteraceae bacterium]